MRSEVIDEILNKHGGSYECTVYMAMGPLEGTLKKRSDGVYQIDAVLEQVNPNTRQKTGARFNSTVVIEAEDIKAIQKVESANIQPAKSILHP